MSLAEFWPSARHCLECIKPEAENPSDAVFLAVHQPTQLVRRSFADGNSQERTEDSLLEEFLREDPSGRVILPILGDSGVGKSHLIRWLDIKLRGLPDAKKRHVIRIPKSSSLKSVLRRILDGLNGPRFDQIRSKLQSAREQMDAIGAEERVRAELLAAIRRRHAAAEARIAKANELGTPKDERDRQWQAHGSPRCLPAILSDPATSRLFMEGTTTRPGMVSEIARHLTEDSREDNAPRRKFEELDFVVPIELESILGEAGEHARRWLQRLQESSGKLRSEATTLLNDIVDDAIAPLATPNDGSLAELFYDVRRQLLAEGRELVLLVEDFAVLAGIQRALLDAMIREAEVAGKREACVIRTALAVTTGYFDAFETVRTRAVHGWYVDEVLDRDRPVTIERMCSFLGAYLNAARFGASTLERLRRNTSGHDVENFRDHVNLSEVDLGRLESYGRSVAGHDLFPFNHTAVEMLADWKFRRGDGRLSFNPRDLINNVLLPVLQEHRDAFESNSFPPSSFLGFDRNQVDPELQIEIRRKESNPATQHRLCALVRFWGGNPRRLADVAIPTGVYETFGLPVVGGAVLDVPPLRLPPALKKPDDAYATGIASEIVRASYASRVPQAILDWEQRLKEWREGTQLQQGDANELRNLISDSLLAHIDWDAHLLRKWRDASTFRRYVFLPNARGGGDCTSENASVVVARDEEFERVASTLTLAMMAVIRHHHFKGWDYAEGESDYGRYLNFLDERQQHAVDWIRAHYERGVDGDPVPSMVQALLVGGRLLNVEGSHSRDDASLVAAVFATAGKPVNQSDEPWDALRREHFERRDALRDAVLDRVAARQGSAAGIYAVDSAVLLSAIRELRKSWSIQSDFEGRPTEENPRRLQAHVRELKRRTDVIVMKWRSAVLKQSAQILAELGDDFDKNSVASAVSDVIELAKSLSLSTETRPSQLSHVLERFQKEPVAECLKHVKSVESEKEGGSLASALAQIDEGNFGLLKEFVELASCFLKEIGDAARGQLAVWGTDSVEQAASALDDVLKGMELHAEFASKEAPQ